MDTLSYSAFRANLSSTMDKVNSDHKPMLITRQNGSSAVLISLDDFHSYEETAYLMASPKNAQRLGSQSQKLRRATSWLESLLKNDFVLV